VVTMPDSTAAERNLMKRVWNLAGPHIRRFSKMTSVPDAFFGALTANETGQWLIHNTIVPSRFESHVQDCLIAVQLGVRLSYGKPYPITLSRLVNATETEIHSASCSHGLTQILGLHCLRWGVPIERLNQAEVHYQYAARLLAEFAEVNQLDVTKDFEAMGRCWNTGEPNGKTYSDSYIPDLLCRMEVWKELEAASNNPPAAAVALKNSNP
jgi:hypothetical protein